MSDSRITNCIVVQVGFYYKLIFLHKNGILNELNVMQLGVKYYFSYLSLGLKYALFKA